MSARKSKLIIVAYKYDCVIFDKSESNFAQFDSSTMGTNFNDITKQFIMSIYYVKC